ncbi:hypothetical protein [Streptomyces auratus]|uniref:hypothetical protein n=1 Tax=Streptomyces TaxID=1883 RepID=UPI001FE953AF|nr:hypothetical protein [Streptomyces auratus]
MTRETAAHSHDGNGLAVPVLFHLKPSPGIAQVPRDLPERGHQLVRPTFTCHDHPFSPLTLRVPQEGFTGPQQQDNPLTTPYGP